MASIIKTVPQASTAQHTTTKIKVTGVLCSLTGGVLLVVAVISPHWLLAEGYQEGLWEECFWGDQYDFTCRSHLSHATWILVCAAIFSVAIVLTLGGSLSLLVHTARGEGHPKKTCLGRTVIGLLAASATSQVAGLLLFTVVFVVKEMSHRTQAVWYFEWAYGVAWGGAMFTSAAALLCVWAGLHKQPQPRLLPYVTNGQSLQRKSDELYRF